MRIIKAKLADHLVEGIQRVKLDAWYEMSLLEEDFQAWMGNLVPSVDPEGAEGACLYDHVLVDSNPERRFVEDLERRDDVHLYVKLPSWFTVPTPIGSYNPDWAVVMDPSDTEEGAGEAPAGKCIYLVGETKSTLNPDALRPDEQRKIDCGTRHFREALGVDYKVATSVSELP